MNDRQRQRDGFAFQKQHARRRGVALFVVMLMLSVTIGLTYAMLHAQTHQVRIQSNANNLNRARQAAMSGLHYALSRMHRSDWVGVDQSVKRKLDSGVSFTVTFTTGDQSLSVSDSDYEYYPYRVTVESVGSAVDPADPDRTMTATAGLVAQLIPRAIGPTPSNWSTVTSNTIYQYSASQCEISFPCRIEGSIWLQGQMEFCPYYYWSVNQETGYMADLERMRQSGYYGDHRPFSGPININWWSQMSYVRDMLVDDLGLSINRITASTPSDWTHPGYVYTYRLYPGGKEYSAKRINSSLSNVSHTPDPKTNPIGLFYVTDPLYVYDNVKIEGTLVGGARYNADIYFYGDNVEFKAHDLPALDGADKPVQLPVAVMADDIRVYDNCDVELKGMVCVWDDFQVAQDYQYDIRLDVEGIVAMKDLRIDPRYDWRISDDTWDYLEDHYEDEDYTPKGGLYYPDWLDRYTYLSYKTSINIAPSGDEVEYGWLQNDEPIYQIGAGDDGLKWKVLSRSYDW